MAALGTYEQSVGTYFYATGEEKASETAEDSEIRGTAENVTRLIPLGWRLVVRARRRAGQTHFDTPLLYLVFTLFSSLIHVQFFIQTTNRLLSLTW